MFRFFSEDNSTFDQTVITNNYNGLVNIFQKEGIKLRELNQSGICAGLTVNYLLYAYEGRHDELYKYLTYLNSLDYIKIKSLADQYRQSANTKELVIHGKGGSFSFNRLLEFLTAVSESQDYQDRPLSKRLGANWDRTSLIFSDKSKLTSKLEDAGIRNGKFMSVSMGRHAFAIERTDGAYSVFDGNNIKKKQWLKTEKAVRDSIIENISEFFPQSNSNVALSISYFSYGNDNREVDDLLAEYREDIDKLELAKSEAMLSPFIKEYREGKLSRAELALVLHERLNEESILSENLIKLNNALAAYLVETGITKEQAALDEMLKENKHLVHDTAYKHSLSILHLAAHTNQITLIKKLLSYGADPNLMEKKDNLTPFHMAVRNGYTQAVEIFLKHGADLTLTDKGDFTALSMAVAAGHTNVARILLDHGADPNIRGREGITALFPAVQDENLEMIKLLLDRGADSNRADIHGMTPLFIAIQKGNAQVVEELLKHGASPIVSTNGGVTPLYVAAQEGQLEIAKMLLENEKHQVKLDTPIKASVEILLDHAKDTGRLEEVKRLFTRKGKLIKNLSNFTPLHAAVFFGHTEVAAMLVSKGANINAKAQGVSVLDLAQAMGRADMIEILEKGQPTPPSFRMGK